MTRKNGVVYAIFSIFHKTVFFLFKRKIIT